MEAVKMGKPEEDVLLDGDPDDEEQLLDEDPGAKQLEEEQEPGEEEEQPEQVTQAWVEGQIESAKREAFGYADRGRVKLKQQLDQVEATIKTADDFGRPFSEAEQEQLRAKARADAMMPDDNDPSGDVSKEQAQEIQYVMDELGADNLRLEGKYGFKVDQKDPEVSMMQITGDPKKDRASQEAMFKAKAKRLKDSKEGDDGPPQRGRKQPKKKSSKAKVRAAGAGGGGQPNPIVNEEDTDKLYEMAANDLPED